MSLLITKAKPNPLGKDRIFRGSTPTSQLAGEWVDIQNISNTSIKLDGVELYHLAYLEAGRTEWRIATDFKGILPAGHIIRVHSGDEIPLSQMRPEDQIGAHYHLFTKKDYIWNNNKKDFPHLWYKPSQQWIDKTEYEAYPTEGKILQRINGRLI